MEKITMKTEDLKVLKSICSTDDQRLALQSINITADHVESTDGHMLFRIKRGDTVQVPNNVTGPHKIVAINKIGGGISEAIIEKTDLEYPDTSRVMPARGNSADDKLISINKDKREPMNHSAAVIKLYVHTGNAYSAHLIARLAPLNGIWACSKAAHDAPVRMDYTCGSEEYTAVITPFQLNK